MTVCVGITQHFDERDTQLKLDNNVVTVITSVRFGTCHTGVKTAQSSGPELQNRGDRLNEMKCSELPTLRK